MSNKVDTQKAFCFYDDRGKSAYLLIVEAILFRINGLCLCSVVSGDDANDGDVVLFNVDTGEVLTKNFDSWYATNDLNWANQEIKRMKENIN